MPMVRVNVHGHVAKRSPQKFRFVITVKYPHSKGATQ